ncbi:MAG: methyltransferase domain-containing protein [Ruminococcaceae bacterium]|nr:methyltransferase domain-containing protein [Oscillospiraceae bacterium]
MASWWEEILKCPVCGAKMMREGNGLFCLGARRHCYDFSKAGYVNLAPSKASGGGDDAALITARTAFLNGEHYGEVARELCRILQTHIPQGTVLDAGCGEGYYSLKMSREGMKVFGVDLSKRGITHAAKSGIREGADAFFAVAGIFDLPVADASLDAVVSLFAPVAEEEFLRVLKPGGILLLAGAGPEHLFSLKRVLYDVPYRNAPRADAPQKMENVMESRVRYTFSADHDTLQHLFAMTPYFYRTSKEGIQRLSQRERLDVDVDVEFSVYKKL